MTVPDQIAQPDVPVRGRRRYAWWIVSAVVMAVVGVGVFVAVAASGAETDTPATAAPPPEFVDDTAGSGVDHSYTGDFAHFVGGGVAVFDCDTDGLGDLYVAGGSSPAALYRNRSAVGGALQFEAVPSEVTDLESVAGAYPIDVDSDGVVDLVVLRNGANVVLRGLGDCRFEPRHRAPRHRRRRRLDHRVQRHMGGRQLAADTRVRDVPRG